MLALKIRKRDLIWDKWNIKHIAKHKVTPGEAEGALKDRGVKAKETYGGRILVIGKSGLRMLAVVLAKEKNGYYVVTARDAGKKERKIYRNEKS